MTTVAHRTGQRINSTLLVIALVIVALLAGWILKTSVTARTEAYQRAGVSAAVPYQWAVKNGLEGESLVFVANPPLDMNRQYQVRLLPVVPGGKVSDLANSRNLELGQALPYYKVSGQQAVRFGGRDGYEVDYSYIKTDTPGKNPEVIRGSDFYFQTPGRVILTTFEDSAQHYSDTLPEFYYFLSTVSYSSGGQP